MGSASSRAAGWKAAGMGWSEPHALEADRVKAEDALDRLDLVFAAVMALTTTGVLLLILAAFGDSLARLGITEQFLDADGSRVVSDMLDPAASHWRLTVHPLFSVLVMPFGWTFKALGAGRLQAVWICNAATAAAAVALLYATQRLLGSPRRAAVLVCLLALSSSAMLFWMTVPETYLAGALSLTACFAVAAASTRGPVADAWLLIAGIFSLGVTITNWSAGILLAAIHRPLGKAAAIVLATLAITAVAWRVEKAYFTGIGGIFLRPESIAAEAEFMVMPKGALAGEFVHPIVAPPLKVADARHVSRSISFQGASILRGGPAAVTAAAGWLVVLAAGLAALVRGPAPPRFRLMLGAFLAAQAALHLVYGTETFLYALHFWVPLMLIAGLAVQADRRGVIQGVLAATILFTSWNNVHRLAEAARVPLDDRSRLINVVDRPLIDGDYPAPD